MKESSLVVALTIFLHWLWGMPAFGVERIYNIVTNQSSIAISGTVTSTTLGTAAIQQQGAGSLTTSYSGTIRTDRSPNTIQFLAGTVADANVTGSWRPLADGGEGTAPADYGARVPFNFLATLFVAARDVVGDLTSGVVSVDTGGNFNLSSVALEFTSGGIAYRDEPLGVEEGSRSLIGEGGMLDGMGSLSSQMQVGGTLETLTIPIDSTVLVATGEGSINLTLTGQVVATALVPSMLPGDYNENGVVDAADYVVWRDNLESPTSLPNDDTPGVGPDDYTRWRSNFGQSLGGGSSAAQLVPEPGPVIFLVSSVFGILVLRCLRRSLT